MAVGDAVDFAFRRAWTVEDDAELGERSGGDQGDEAREQIDESLHAVLPLFKPSRNMFEIEPSDNPSQNPAIYNSRSSLTPRQGVWNGRRGDGFRHALYVRRARPS